MSFSFGRRRLLAWVGGGGGSGLLACCKPHHSSTPSRTAENLPPYDGPLVDPQDIPGNFVWQQRVRATHGSKSGAFDAVLQKDGAELLVLGLSPFRTRGFALRQVGRKFTYEQYVPFQLPFSPSAVLIDIHRAFFFGLLGSFPDDGSRSSRFRGETVMDEFRSGRLVRRTFSSISGTDGNLLVTYQLPGYAWLTPPATTSLDNRAYGYRLQIETSSVDPLP